MGYSCCSSSCSPARSFLTKDERIGLLQDYKKDLENEAMGVAEKIREMEKSDD